MKRSNTLFFALLLFITSATSGCQAIGDIFKAGVWVGVIIVVVVIAIILWLISKSRKS